MLAKDRESSRRQRGAQAVGDSVAGVLRLQSAGGERTVGIIRAFGLAAKHAHVGANPFGTETRAAEQSTAADRREHRVQVANLFEQLFRGCSRSEERRVGKECRSRWS